MDLKCLSQTTLLMGQTWQTRVSTWHLTQHSSSVFHTSCPSSNQTQSMHMRLVGELFFVLICPSFKHSNSVCVQEFVRDRLSCLLDLSYFLHSKPIICICRKRLGKFCAGSVLLFTKQGMSIQSARDRVNSLLDLSFHTVSPYISIAREWVSFCRICVTFYSVNPYVPIVRDWVSSSLDLSRFLHNKPICVIASKTLADI